MKITIVSVGKIKEKFYKNAISEYEKRMLSYAKLEMITLKDEKVPQSLSEKSMEQVKQIEGNRILNALQSEAFIVVLDKAGKNMDSVEFSKKIQDLAIRGKSHIVFVIGGSLGLSSEVVCRADLLLSFSDMTFPHQLMKVILLEQIYRAFKIAKGEAYHK